MPFANLLEDRVGDPADQIGRNLDAVNLHEVRLDLANRQAARIQANDAVIETVKAGLPLGHELRLEGAVAVARNRDLDRAVVADHGFARIAVATVAAAAASRGALLVAQMLCQLGAERSLQ